MKSTLSAISTLQRALTKHFGKGNPACGESTLYISADKIDLTNLNGTIVARGPVKVATVLLRRCRKTGNIKR
jgi:hypothetical protein